MDASLLRVLAAAALVAAPAPALAYIDPGTGSMLLQSLLAAVAAALVFGRTAWQKVKDLLSRGKGKSPPAED